MRSSLSEVSDSPSEPSGTPVSVAPTVPAAPDDALLGVLPERLRTELVAFRRDVPMHPELGRQEFRTTAAVKGRLEHAGLKPRVMPGGTGLICDIGDTDPERPRLPLGADLDALAIPDTKRVDYRSTVPGRAHACGH